MPQMSVSLKKLQISVLPDIHESPSFSLLLGLLTSHIHKNKTHSPHICVVTTRKPIHFS